MNRTFARALAALSLIVLGAAALSGCDKKGPPTPSTSMESPGAAPMASSPASGVR